MANIVRSVTNSDNVPTTVWIAVGANQTIEVGDLIQINGTSRKGEAAVAASTTIVGIANGPITTGGTVTNDDRIPVVLVRSQVVRIPFNTAGTKTTFADTDKYTTAYDLSNKNLVNPDDTTGGMCFVQEYDNDGATVDVIFAAASLANVG